MTGTKQVRLTALVALASVVALSSGCKASPCSDSEASLKGELANLPVLSEGASVCNYRNPEEGGRQSAMIMEWGKPEEMSKAQNRMLLELSAAGWESVTCGGPMVTWVDPNELCFDKGSAALTATFALSESGVFIGGGNPNRSSITTHLNYYPG